jgi:hypothetical protein
MQAPQDNLRTANYVIKRRILEIVELNSTLDGAKSCPVARKPFPVLVNGPLSKKVGVTGRRRAEKRSVFGVRRASTS